MNSYLNLEDLEDIEDERPYDSISSRPPNPEVKDGEQSSISDSVKGAISKRFNSGDELANLDESLMEDLQASQAIRQKAQEQDARANLSQGLDAFSRGVNAPVSNQGLYANLAKQSENNLNSAVSDVQTRSKVKSAIASKLIQANENQANRDQSATLNHDLRMDLKRVDLDARAEAARLKAQEKEALEDSARAVPGYSRSGAVKPTLSEVSKFRNATAAAETLQKKLKRMNELVDQYGSFEYGGQGGTEMESLATEIQLLAKNEDMYQLGVLTGPDLTMLNKVISDPTTLGSIFTRDSTRKKQLDTLSNSIREKLGAKSKSLGYQEEGQKAAEGSVPSPKKSIVKKGYNPKTNQTQIIYSDGTKEVVDGKQ